MNYEIQKFTSTHALVQAATHCLIDKIYDNLQEQETCHVALDCDETLLAVYELLATPPYCDRVQWGKTRIFQVSEIITPELQRGRNFHSLNEILLEQVHLPAQNFYRLHTDVPTANFGAYDMDNAVKNFTQNAHRLDLLVLGLDGENPVASMLVQSKAKNDAQNRILKTASQSPDLNYIMLAPSVLKSAREIIFIVSGAGKPEIVENVYKSFCESDRPGSFVTWLVDAKAGDRLP